MESTHISENDHDLAMDLLASHRPTQFVVGDDRISELGKVAKGLGANRVMVFSDPGIVAAGHTARGIHALKEAGIACELFDAIEENPNTDHVDAGVAAAKSFAPDLLVGLGGGSSMDCAKGVNFIYSCGGRMQDYWGVGKATADLLPMIAVPTTSGTGSESQSFALISDAQSHAKMACGDKKAAFRAAILDARLTLTQPPQVTAVTGMDAISHALETFVCNKRTPYSQTLSRTAWEKLARNYAQVIQDPENLAARREMQIGASLSGMAIENSMLGAAHATANPLTARFGIVHGNAVGMMLPHVVRWNAETMDADYQELARLIDLESSGELANRLGELLALAGIPTALSHYQIDRETLPELADEAAKQWTANFNPRPMTEADMLLLYERAYS